MNCEIIYSARKTVSIKIEKGKVIIKAPVGASEQEIKKIVIKHKAWIEKALEREKLKREKYESVSEAEVKLLKQQAKLYFNNLCEKYAALMGVSYKRITVTSAKKRFGSCSSEKNISFSYLLMLYPEAAREYVAVHELAHLIEMNHSKRFYAIIEKYLPDYRERKKLLKVN